MESLVVVSMAAVFGHAADLVQAGEDVAVQDLGAKGPVEAFDAGVLGRLARLDVQQLRHLHAGVLVLPDVVRRLADAVLAACLGDLRAGLDLLEDPDDLFLAELRLLHAELLGWETLLLNGSNQRGRFNVPLAGYASRSFKNGRSM